MAFIAMILPFFFFIIEKAYKQEKFIMFDFVIVAGMRWKLSKEPDIFSKQ